MNNDSNTEKILKSEFSLDDVQSLSNAYGLTLGRRGPRRLERTLIEAPTGSSPDIRGLSLDNLKYNSSIHNDILVQKLREENELLKKEASIREAKLQSNIRSIRTFWSPELKKERNTRKEHESRGARLEADLRSIQDDRPENILFTENTVLRRAIQDLEARVQTQRETLEAREISLRRALQIAAAHEQNLSGKGIQSEDTFRTLLSIKDDKIAALEKCVQDIKRQLRVYEAQFGSPHGSHWGRQPHGSSDDQLLTQNSFLKIKADGLKSEVSLRAAEIINLKTRLESFSRSDQETRNHLEAVRESLNAKSNRCAQLQSDNERLRSRLNENYQFSSPQHKAERPLSHELEVKEHQVKLLKSRYENLELQLAEKDRKLVELEDRINMANGLSSRDEKTSSEARVAIKALEDALSDKDLAMKRERERFELELKQERNCRLDLQSQLDNPEENEREKMEMRLQIQKLQAQCQMGQQALQDQDQRAAKAEALAARIKGQLEGVLKDYDHNKNGYTVLQQKFNQLRRAREKDEKILMAAKREAATHCLNELDIRAEILDMKGKKSEAKQVRDKRAQLQAQFKI